jgi:hypothetical protein
VSISGKFIIRKSKKEFHQPGGWVMVIPEKPLLTVGRIYQILKIGASPWVSGYRAGNCDVGSNENLD